MATTPFRKHRIDMAVLSLITLPPNLFAVNLNFLWAFKPKANTATRAVNHGEYNVLADHNTLADLTGQD
jgi:hypothetical protein